MRRSRLERVRESLRLQQIYNLFLRYGMDILLDRGVLGDFRRMMQSWIYSPSQPLVPLTTPVKARLMIEELGPIYVKMGQLISSQAAVLPDEWERELVKLQNNVPPFPQEDVYAAIIDELGAPPEELYAEFNPEPMAAASLGQVHKAVLHNGQKVVVKVQRPNITNRVKADLGIMDNAVRVYSRRSEWARDLDLVGVLNEFGSNILTELDYGNEAYNAFKLSRNLESIEGVKIPTIYPELSTSKVLTMEFVDGVKISNLEAIQAAGIDLKTIADVTLLSAIKQMLIDGFFHADLHPGNLLVNLETGDVTYIDTGMVGELDFKQRLNLISLFIVLNQGDTKGVAQAFLGVSKPFKEFDENAYYKDFERRVGRFMEYDTNASFSQNVNLVFDILQKHGLRLDSQFTLALKTMTQAETIATLLFPEAGIIAQTNKYIQDLAIEQVTAENITKVVTKEGSQIVRELVQRMPTLHEATLSWLNQYEKGRFELYLDTADLAKEVNKASNSMTQVTLGILLVGMIIGSSIAASFASITGDYWSLMPRVAFVGYTVSMLIAAIVVFGLLRRLWGKKGQD